jgi:hypothetical protein
MAVRAPQSALTSYHLEDWNAETNEEVNDHPTTFLFACGHSTLMSSNLVESTVDTKGASWDCNVKPNLNVGHCRIRQ